MNKTRITAIVTVSKKIEVELDYLLSSDNTRQMDTLKDLLETKFHLNTNVINKDFDITEILVVREVSADS